MGLTAEFWNDWNSLRPTVLFLSRSGGPNNRRQIDEMVELKCDSQTPRCLFRSCQQLTEIS